MPSSCWASVWLLDHTQCAFGPFYALLVASLCAVYHQISSHTRRRYEIWEMADHVASHVQDRRMNEYCCSSTHRTARVTHTTKLHLCGTNYTKRPAYRSELKNRRLGIPKVAMVHTKSCHGKCDSMLIWCFWYLCVSCGIIFCCRISSIKPWYMFWEFIKYVQISKHKTLTICTIVLNSKRKRLLIWSSAY